MVCKHLDLSCSFLPTNLRCQFMMGTASVFFSCIDVWYFLFYAVKYRIDLTILENTV